MDRQTDRNLTDRHNLTSSLGCLTRQMSSHVRNFIEHRAGMRAFALNGWNGRFFVASSWPMTGLEPGQVTKIALANEGRKNGSADKVALPYRNRLAMAM